MKDTASTQNEALEILNINPKILSTPKELMALFEKSSPSQLKNIIDQYFRPPKESVYYQVIEYLSKKNNDAYICFLFMKDDLSVELTFSKTQYLKKAFNYISENEYPNLKKNLEVMLNFKEYNIKHFKKWYDHALSLEDRKIKIPENSYANLRATEIIGAILGSQNLQCFDLGRTRLEKVELSDSNLRYANLNRTFLIKTNFLRADLRHANLSYSRCHNVNFNFANLENANLSYCDFGDHYYGSSLSYLTNVNLVHANMKGMRITHATLENASFFNEDMLKDMQVFKKELNRLYDMLHDNPDIGDFKVAIVDDIAKKAEKFDPKLKEEIYHTAYNHQLLQHRHLRPVKDFFNSVYTFFGHYEKDSFHRQLIETNSQERLTRNFGV